MGGHITVPAVPKDKAASSPRKGDNLISRYMKPEHKRMSRMLGYTLLLGDARAWQGFGLLSAVRMSHRERSFLAAVTLATLPIDTVEDIAAQAIGAIGTPLPAFLGGMEDARWWASYASVNELKAYALASFQALPGKEQSAFFRFINEIEVPA